jgi:hypothetical protein
MTPTRPIPAAIARIAIDARAAAWAGHGIDLTGLRGGAAIPSGLPRAA